jgi:DNA-binding NarL/FixJ family response regulator
VLADDVLPDMTFQDLGEHRLKDLDRPEHVYQLVVPDLPRVFPPPHTLPADESDAARSEATAAPTAVASAIAKPALRVVVADDSVLIREGLSRLLADCGFDVIAMAADAEELLREVGRGHANVAITDIKMPPTHVEEGLVEAAEIRRLHPEVGALVLSQYLDTAYAMRLLVDFPERVGYLLKGRVYDIAILSDAIRRSGEGECVVDPTIAFRLMGRKRGESPLARLSARERTILGLVAEGRTDEAITEHLGVILEAYEAELRDVFVKLGLSGTCGDLRRVVVVLDYLARRPESVCRLEDARRAGSGGGTEATAGAK